MNPLKEACIIAKTLDPRDLELLYIFVELLREVKEDPTLPVTLDVSKMRSPTGLRPGNIIRTRTIPSEEPTLEEAVANIERQNKAKPSSMPPTGPSKKRHKTRTKKVKRRSLDSFSSPACRPAKTWALLKQTQGFISAKEMAEFGDDPTMTHRHYTHALSHLYNSPRHGRYMEREKFYIENKHGGKTRAYRYKYIGRQP